MNRTSRKYGRRLTAVALTVALVMGIALPGAAFADTAGGARSLGAGFSWPSFRGNDDNNAVVDIPTPKSAEDGELYWAVKKGSGWGSSAIGVPIIVEDSLIFCSGTGLFRANKYTGEIDYATVGTMAAAPNFNIVPPTYADGKIFVALQSSMIQAFDAKTLQPLWIFKHDGNIGQGNTQITYRDGYIYSGFWRSETADGDFVCVSAKDDDPSVGTEVKTAEWSYTTPGGFYWAGAYVTDNFLLVGTDDGANGYTSQTSKFLSLDPKTGAVIDKIDGLNADIRSTVSHDPVTDRYYFGSKGGSFYSAAVNANGTFPKKADGVLGYDLKELKLEQLPYGKNDTPTPAMITSTPVITDGRAYVGIGGASQFGKYAGHGIAVIDLAGWTVAYRARTMGYPQSSGLVTTAYKAADGYNYIYFTDNYTPGIVRVLKDKPGMTAVEGPMTDTYVAANVTYTANDIAPALFTPVSPQAQYCLGSVIPDAEGTLYFKNDSAHIMAFGSRNVALEITAKPAKTLYKEGEKFDPAGMKVTAVLANGVRRDVTDLVKFSTAALTADDRDVTIIYDNMMYHDIRVTGAANRGGIASDPIEAVVDIGVAATGNYDNIRRVENLIDAIGTVTLGSEPAIVAARTAYNDLSVEERVLVGNRAKLDAAEKALGDLKSGVGVTGWKKIGASWYYFDGNGKAKTGWQQIGKAWYYFDPASGSNQGAMKTGWQQIGKTWYYLDPASGPNQGVMKTGWQRVGGSWYYLEGSGAMKTGWLRQGGAWYYLDGSGKMKTGWQQVGKTWYYFGGAGDGKMKTGKLKIGAKTYVFNASGAWVK
jgi:hypothetical protein